MFHSKRSLSGGSLSRTTGVPYFFSLTLTQQTILPEHANKGKITTGSVR